MNTIEESEEEEEQDITNTEPSSRGGNEDDSEEETNMTKELPRLHRLPDQRLSQDALKLINEDIRDSTTTGNGKFPLFTNFQNRAFLTSSCRGPSASILSSHTEQRSYTNFRAVCTGL